jgi:hypothetical protein
VEDDKRGKAVKFELNLSRQAMRKLNKLFFWLWIFPGIPVSIYLRNSIAWVVFLSVYAIVIAHLIEWRQEEAITRTSGPIELSTGFSRTSATSEGSLNR